MLAAACSLHTRPGNSVDTGWRKAPDRICDPEERSRDGRRGQRNPAAKPGDDPSADPKISRIEQAHGNQAAPQRPRKVFCLVIAGPKLQVLHLGVVDDISDDILMLTSARSQFRQVALRLDIVCAIRRPTQCVLQSTLPLQ